MTAGQVQAIIPDRIHGRPSSVWVGSVGLNKKAIGVPIQS
ncbi:hypothetical protein FRUB_00382 [Fimbriiglobus ruber]|uniref:Uncharacterized protein n=1 Tax=Fimbriiglobus ruber TaxID=1908690 RepID=A0A225E0E9_9BACT|nr:hypothetical protein FRUB_00382 [Fimbriiglobus ruber]